MRIVREEPPLEAEAPDKLPEAAEEKLVETVEVSESNETVEKREATQKSTVSEDTGTTEDTTPSAPNDMEALKARQADLYDDETGSADEVQREYSSPPPLADRHLSRRNGGRKAAEAVMPEKPKKKWEKLRNLSVSEKPTVEAEGKSETATPSEVKRRGRPKRPSPVESATEDEVMTSPQQQPKKKADSPIPEDPEISVVRSTTPTKEMNSGDQQEALDHVKSLVRVELEIKQSLLIGHFNFPRCISVLETFKVSDSSTEIFLKRSINHFFFRLDWIVAR